MTLRRTLVLAACTMALSVVQTAAQAQGVLDRLLGDDPGRQISPADLMAAGIWVYDPIQGLSNFPEAEMRAGPYMLVVPTRSTQAPSVVLRLDTGTEFTLNNLIRQLRSGVGGLASAR